MAKRAASVSSDDEASANGSQDDSGFSSVGANKRARTTPSSSRANGNAADEDEAMDEDDEQMEEDETDDEENERLVAASNKLTAAAAAKTGSTIRTAGVVEQVDLIDFMCHKYVTVTLGPQINFIIGQNGSGKSAVLAAITMGLGGSAKATSRGENSKGLVRDGATSATVSVRLKNVGEEAYQPDVFGKSITVTRRINKDGSGSYKIQDEKLKTIDTKKSSLNNITDHFGIQVDNPLTVLTQETAKTLLTSTKPSETYKFFLDGTQLSQLTTEYEIIRSNAEQIKDAVIRKEEVMPELKKAFSQAEDRLKRAKRAVSLKDKIADLKVEMIWSYVTTAEDKIAAIKTQLDQKTKERTTLEDGVNALAEEAAEISGAIADLEAAMQETTEAFRLKEGRREEVENELKKLTGQVREIRDQERSLNQVIDQHKGQIAEYEQQIAAAEAKLARDIDAERAPILRKIELAQEGKKQLEQQVEADKAEIVELEEVLDKKGEEFRAVRDEMQRTQQQEANIRGAINNISAQAKNDLLRFSPKHPMIIAEIEKRRWTKKPLGPIGRYLVIKKPFHLPLLEAFFNVSLNGFIVEHEEDRQQFMQMIRSIGGEALKANCYKEVLDPNFSLNGNEPDPEFQTVLRTFDFKDPLVRQVLINVLRIEAHVLVETRKEAETLVYRNLRNVMTIYIKDMYSFRSLPGGGMQASGMEDWRGSRLGFNQEQQVSRMRKDLEENTETLTKLRQDMATLDAELRGFTSRKNKASDRLRQSDRQMARFENDIDKASSQLREEEREDIEPIRQAKKVAEEELEAVTSQSEGISAMAAPLVEQVKPLQEEKQALKEEFKQKENRNKKLSDKIAERTKALATKGADQTNSARKIEKLVTDLTNLGASMEEAQGILEERLEPANEAGERPDKRRGTEKIRVELAKEEKTLKAQEKEQGATLEQIMAEFDTRSKVYHDAKGKLSELKDLNKVLLASYNKRITRWLDFRTHISERANTQFYHHLSKRGFRGRLHFDHENSKLALRVQTEDRAGQTQRKDKIDKKMSKETKSLSGGEKSFTTICLLLTMWDSVSAPVRCLDEYDVYMDDVNRRISTKMLIDAAKTTDGAQFTFISPLAMNALKFGSEVRVTRMNAPRADQSTLPFQAE